MGEQKRQRKHSGPPDQTSTHNTKTHKSSRRSTTKPARGNGALNPPPLVKKRGKERGNKSEKQSPTGMPMRVCMPKHTHKQERERACAN